MKTLILSDGLDGHYNQSIGIAAILQETTLPSYKVVEVKLKFTFLRGLQYTYIKLLSKNLTNTNIKIILSFFNKIDPSEYALLISTGGKLSVFNAAIAKKFNIKNIHNGSLRGISNEYFEATIVLGGKIKKNSNSIHTILPPNRFNPLNHAKNKNKVLFLIGGNGSGYKYKKEDFIELCKQIIKYAKYSGKSPVIVTSRRTKNSHELLIKDNLKDYLDDKSIWFHSGLGRINLLNIFELVDEVFVTEDSSSMIAESISSGFYVYTIAPMRVKKDKDHLKMLYQYEDMGFIKRLNFNSTFSDYISMPKLSNKEKILNLRRMLRDQIFQKLETFSLKILSQ